MAATLTPRQRELATKAVQMGFDFEALTRQPWAGPAPLHFTTEAFTVAELGAAWDRYIEENGHFDCIRKSHMWHGVGEYLMGARLPKATPGVHSFTEMTVDLRCAHYRRYGEEPCLCVGRQLTRVQCDECGFLHIGEREEGIMLWHDLHWKGWRLMPVAPLGTKDVKKWALANFPKAWQVDGAPIVTRREGLGLRSVPGRSPWGGFDIADHYLRRDVIYDYDLAIAAGQLPEPKWRVQARAEKEGTIK